jgi:hypothetical protein
MPIPRRIFLVKFFLSLDSCGAVLAGSIACSLPGGLNRWSVLTVVYFTEREYH